MTTAIEKRPTEANPTQNTTPHRPNQPKKEPHKQAKQESGRKAALYQETSRALNVRAGAKISHEGTSSADALCYRALRFDAGCQRSLERAQARTQDLEIPATRRRGFCRHRRNSQGLSTHNTFNSAAN
jgi:hypothetical protein